MVTETATATAPVATTGAPEGLHHVAYVTHDTAATMDFYTRVMRMPLCSVVIDDAVPSTGDPFPYIHLFFRMKDGSTVAFFESLGLPPPAPATHPAYHIFNHLALNAASRDEVDEWAKHLGQQGVDFIGPVEHGIIYSIYFFDPNGIRLEITTDIVPSWRNNEEKATTDMQAWQRIKAMTAAGDSNAALEWIKSRRAEHKRNL